MDCDNEKIILTKEQAIDFVGGKREYIHSFKNPRGMLIGADCSWNEFEKALDAAKEITIGGPICQEMKHDLVIFDGESQSFFERLESP